MKNKIRVLGSLTLLSASLLVMNSCSSMPKGAKVIQDFEKDKYLGNWYEIARLDFIFEKNLNNTTAEYSLNEDGTIQVVNRGYNYIKNKDVASTGKVKFAGDAKEGKLKVSFFGPFYSGYNIIGLDSDYKYALVAGKSLKYLWLLSRDKTMPQEVKEAYLKTAKDLGYKTSELIWVKHN
ncbi:apolipoprotein D and lipocalin family protein [Flavobacterium sp. CG_9.1]|nr:MULTISPECIES: lipocalin family protein [Flavobacterium]MBG6061289.1 apolipoprotein D and lipocalin family protein [Flavobacterium sp. CG_9.1]